MSELDKFLEERSKIPIPSGDVARIKLLAKELALGVHRGLWEIMIVVAGSYSIIEELRSGDQDNLQPFIEKRWGDKSKQQLLDLLVGYEYVSTTNGYEIAPSAFRLVDETEPYNVFISYRRVDSSAFALLCLARLKEYGVAAFVDMALEAGGNWHADLEARIKENDYFIILLGQDTLSSPMTLKEIEWALKYDKTIIPIWHNKFTFKPDEWDDVPSDVISAIERANAIIVRQENNQESASTYNTAIVELLNRFGVTP